MTHYNQNDPIYSFDPEQEELEIEYWGRIDYIQELRAEHAEDPEGLAFEAEWEHAEFCIRVQDDLESSGPRFKFFVDHEEEIPF
jgi:hypothetical protein